LRIAITSLLVNATKLSSSNQTIYLSFIKEGKRGVFKIDYIGDKIDRDEAKILSKSVDDIYYNNTQNPMALNLELSIAKKVIDLHSGKLYVVKMKNIIVL